MSDIFALVDCNNFYASCERLFLPGLEKTPLVVLSNNDGCVIARSEEAKSLGIRMGIPAFEVSDIIRKKKVRIFSTNYTLYGDISKRVMNVLTQYTPHMEIYSIDEAFLDVSFLEKSSLESFARNLKNKVYQHTGIPVSIGLASTKTLAKTANHLAKTLPALNGVLSLKDNPGLDEFLNAVPVNEIWGVGEKYNDFFNRAGIFSALDLKKSNEYHVRNHLGVVGQRLVLELNGQVCYGLDTNPESKKEICTSRSFGQHLSKYHELEEATTTYAARVARKLRDQRSLAQSLLVFVMTNKYAKGPQYVNYKVLSLPSPTNQTQALIHYSRIILKSLFRTGYQYKKSGVIVSELIPDTGKQTTIWDNKDFCLSSRLTEVMDKLNKKSGRDTVKFAIQGPGESWKMKQNNLSPNYTTQWNDLLSVNMDSIYNSY